MFHVERQYRDLCGVRLWWRFGGSGWWFEAFGHTLYLGMGERHLRTIDRAERWQSKLEALHDGAPDSPMLRLPGLSLWRLASPGAWHWSVSLGPLLIARKCRVTMRSEANPSASQNQRAW